MIKRLNGTHPANAPPLPLESAPLMTEQSRRFLPATFWSITLLTTLPGCTSNHIQASEVDQVSAVDTVTEATCDWYQRCGLIATDKVYASRDSCESQVRAQWDRLWPTESCDDNINTDKLDACVTALDATECQNGLDAMNTLVSKCPESKVCSGD